MLLVFFSQHTFPELLQELVYQTTPTLRQEPTFPSCSTKSRTYGNTSQMASPQRRVVVSVSTSRSRRLGTYQRLVSVSSREKLSMSRYRLGLGHLRLVPKTNFCRWHRTQCEWALDIVSLRCSYYCSHINTLKTMNVKDNI